MIFVMDETGAAMYEVRHELGIAIFNRKVDGSYEIEINGYNLAKFKCKDVLVAKRDNTYFKMAVAEDYELYCEDEISEHDYKQAIKEVDEFNLYQKSLCEAVFAELVDTINEKLQKNEGGVIYIERIIKHEKECLDLELAEE